MGPICVNEKLAPYLPGHLTLANEPKAIPAVSATLWKRKHPADQLCLHKMLGADGLKSSTEYAILNANYMRARLSADYPILYTSKNGTCAHEFIIDLRPFKQSAGIEAEDVAKG